MTVPYTMRRLSLACVLLLVAHALPVIAQSASPSGAPAPASDNSTLDSILLRLQDNLIAYRSSLPELSCSEHVRSRLNGLQTQSRRVTGALGGSQGVPNGMDAMTSQGSSVSGVHSSRETTTDSLFTLRKKTQPDGGILFSESREIKKVDGMPSTAEVETLSGPYILYGVFSDGLDIITSAARSCFKFKLHAPRQSDPSKDIVIDFKTLPVKERAADCPQLPESYGRAYIDQATMHIVRMEKSTPNHQLYPGVVGLWSWSAEYGPVQLDGKSFWMPKSLRSTSVGTQSNYTWSFEGTYADYHLFHADVRIVPEP